MNIFSRLQAELKPRRCKFAGPRVAGPAMEVAGEIRWVPVYNDMPTAAAMEKTILLRFGGMA